MSARRATVAAALVLLLGLAGSSTFAAVEPSERPLTVGEFAVRLAASLRLDAARFEAEALRSLQDLGLVLDREREDPLRQQDLADTLRELGLDVTTSRPDAPVSGPQLQRVLSMYGTGGQEDGSLLWTWWENGEDGDDGDDDDDGDGDDDDGDDGDDDDGDDGDDDDGDDGDDDDVISPSDTDD